MRLSAIPLLIVLTVLTASSGADAAQTPAPAGQPGTPGQAGTPSQPPAPAAGVPLPSDYVIGPDDQLQIVFWREEDLSRDVAVRPDGKISLPLLNDVQAAGLTPEQLRVSLTQAAVKFVEEPTVTVVVKAINSRRVYITGMVAKQGQYPLNAPTTVMQLIALAGGVLEYADSKNIAILRTENGKPTSIRFNYNDVLRRRNLQQNIELKPGDTIIVP